MINKLSLRDLSFKGKKTLVRVDFNVPFTKEGKISDDTRITATLPTLRYILEQGGSLILMSHLGRPKGKVNPALSLKPCAERLSELLQRPVKMAPDCVGPETQAMAAKLQPGEVLLLENLRFHEAEEHPEKDPSFAQQLALLGDVFVNDAFGAAHRAHSSTVYLPKLFPGKAAMGRLMEKELNYLSQVFFQPERPFVAIVGGAKVSSKLGVLASLIHEADTLILGGAMAFTFLAAQGKPIGDSLYEADLVEKATNLLEEAAGLGIRVLLPLDQIIAKRGQEATSLRCVSLEEGIPEGYTGFDIGPQTVEAIEKEVSDAALVLWNGPLGAFETKPFDKGTMEVARCIASSPAISILGGGDSIAAVQASGLAHQFSHISTGGGATLEYLEYRQLPGVAALSSLQEYPSGTH